MRRAAAALGSFLLDAQAGALDSERTAFSPAALIGRTAPRPARASPTVMLATAIGGSGGSASIAAAVGVAAAHERSRGVLLIDLDPTGRARGPTLLASDRARELEDEVRALGGAYSAAAARGRLCYLPLELAPDGKGAGEDDGVDPLEAAARVLDAGVDASAVIVHIPQSLWARAIADPRLRLRSALMRAELPADRALAALAVRELHERRLRAKVVSRPLGMVASRRALAGIDPAGAASVRATRLSRALLGDLGR